MRVSRVKAAAMTAAASALAVTGVAVAGGNDDSGARGHTFRATLTSYQEVPAVSSPARGTFRATVTSQGEIQWELRYAGLEAPVQQAHIHFAQPSVNGGVSAFLCSNLPDRPPSTQPCPNPPATVRGTVTAANVVGPGVQGIEPGALGELLAAMRAGVTYANVHSDKFPNGETRGQIHARGR